MALTTRTNGSGSQNLITAAWFNDAKDCLTGVMTDQPITIQNAVALKYAGTTPATCSGSLQAGTNLGTGLYDYAYSYVYSNGAETAVSNNFAITTTTGNQKVALTGITVGPTNTTTRNIYRSKVGGGQLYFVASLNDNTTTTYTDTTADASLTQVNPPDAFNNGLLFLHSDNSKQAWIVGNNNISGGHLCFYTASNTGKFTFGMGTTPSTGTNPSILDITYNTSSNITALTVPAGLGIKNQGGTKLLELKSTGVLVIGGTSPQYLTSTASVGTGANASYDSFDVGEDFEVDQEYSNGTVVCPGPNDKMVRCTHDNCPCAMVISLQPGFRMGGVEGQQGVQPIALCGRVKVKTAHDVPFRSLVVSDGRGGVRPIEPNQPSFTLGFALHDAEGGQVGIFLRPMFCIVKG